MKIFYFARLINCLRRISKNPNDTTAAISVADNLYKLGLLAHELTHLTQYSENVEKIKSRKLLNSIDLRKLQTFPEGTLGRQYSNHMLKNNLQPDFYENIKVTDDTTFIMMWLRQTHDFWHVITGFDTTVPGELGLQAFMFAQLKTPLAPLLIGSRILVATFKNFNEVFDIFKNVSMGFAMGSNAKNIFALPWDTKYQTPLSDLQKEYGVK